MSILIYISSLKFHLLLTAIDIFPVNKIKRLRRYVDQFRHSSLNTLERVHIFLCDEAPKMNNVIEIGPNQRQI